jgi:hypothetical protein
MTTRHRIGTFLILVGLTLLVIFLGSVMSKQINVTFLILSMVALLSGYQLRRNRPVNDSGRFSVVRRMQARSQQRREDRLPEYPDKK